MAIKVEKKLDLSKRVKIIRRTRGTPIERILRMGLIRVHPDVARQD